MRLHENSIERKKSNPKYYDCEPEDLGEKSKRREVFEYLLENPGADSVELSEKLNAYPNIAFILCEKGLLNRVMDESVARYRYWVKKKYQGDLK